MEKRKMYNAYADLEGYNCFGCSPTNPYGLKCKFVDEGEYITCHWVPSENYQGFFHVLHGGIQATLIDEIASWAIFSHEKTAGVTTEMQVKYRRPVRTDQGEIWLRAKVWLNCSVTGIFRSKKVFSIIWNFISIMSLPVINYWTLSVIWLYVAVLSKAG